MLDEFWQTHKETICAGAVALTIIGIVIVIVLWLSGEFDSQSDQSNPSDQLDQPPAGLINSGVRLRLPATVHYNNGRDQYTVNYPVGSVIYRNTSGEMSRFILPPGGPAQILPNRTTRYNVSVDVPVTHNSHNAVMPAGSLIQLETTTDDKAVFCTWTSGEVTMLFIANPDSGQGMS